MIAKPEILQSVEHMIKSKIRKIFVNEKILKNIVLKFMKLIRIIMSITKKIKVDENDHNYILFSVDFNFSKCILAVEVDGKGHTDRDLIFEKKRQEALEKKLIVILLELILVKKINRAGNIWFSGTRKSVLLKESSGERCAPRNFVLLMMLRGTHVCLIVCFGVHQIK